MNEESKIPHITSSLEDGNAARSYVWDKKDYEIAFLLTSPEAAKDLINVLNQHQAEVFHQSPLAEVRLAYPIKKHTSGQFGFYQFKSDPEAVKKIREVLLLTNGVIRFMIITPPVKLAVAAQPRQERKPSAPVMSNEMLEGKLEEMLK